VPKVTERARPFGQSCIRLRVALNPRTSDAPDIHASPPPRRHQNLYEAIRKIVSRGGEGFPTGPAQCLDHDDFKRHWLDHNELRGRGPPWPRPGSPARYT